MKKAYGVVSEVAINYLRYTGRKRISDNLFLVAVLEHGLNRKNCCKQYREQDKTLKENKQYPLKVKKKSKRLFGIQKVTTVLILSSVITE